MSEKEKILIVDDEPHIRTILLRKLTELGYSCHHAEDGLAGLKKAYSDDYDLVIADVKMPNLNGIEMPKQLKLLKPDLPVVVLSAFKDINTVRVALKEGAYDYIFKPFDFEMIENTIKRALEKGQLLREIREHQIKLEEDLVEKERELKTLFIGNVATMLKAIEAKNKYTEGHSSRVSELSAKIAKKLDLSVQEVEDMRLAGLLHDIGKLGIPEDILNKPGKLTEDEYERVKAHPVVGEGILKPMIKSGTVLAAIRGHHERYDGRGFPDGLKGEEIPLGARILALAEAYDTMTSDNEYSKALPKERAIFELKRCTGTQFDPTVVKAFLELEGVEER